MPRVRAHVAPPLGAVWLVREAPALCLSGAGAAPRSAKRGISRRFSRKQAGDAVLFMDWTLWRLFPPLRAAWSRRGEPALVPLTGQNAKRVLFGAINLHTGPRVVLIGKRAGGAAARAFFQEWRRR